MHSATLTADMVFCSIKASINKTNSTITNPVRTLRQKIQYKNEILSNLEDLVNHKPTLVFFMYPPLENTVFQMHHITGVAVIMSKHTALTEVKRETGKLRDPYQMSIKEEVAERVSTSHEQGREVCLKGSPSLSSCGL